MRDSERRNALSMDDLIMRTIGQMDLLPDRLQSIEEHIRELEMNFSNHEGQQSEGVKRISDRITGLERIWSETRDETIKKFLEINDEIKLLKTREGITEEQKKILSDLEENVALLQKDYGERQLVKKTIWSYVSKIIEYGLKYAMLPITVTILLFLGFSPDIISGFKNKPPVSSEDVYSNSVISLMTYINNNQITESDLNLWMKTNDIKKHIIISEESDDNVTLKQNIHNLSEKIFIWIPKNSKSGYIQLYGKNGVKLGSRISVIRGV